MFTATSFKPVSFAPVSWAGLVVDVPQFPVAAPWRWRAPTPRRARLSATLAGATLRVRCTVTTPPAVSGTLRAQLGGARIVARGTAVPPVRAARLGASLAGAGFSAALTAARPTATWHDQVDAEALLLLLT